MSKKLLIAAAAVAISSGAMAQSAFEGFYGQLGVGYENNSFASKTVSASDGNNAVSAPSQSAGGFSGAVGLGYNYAVAPNLVLGLGVDYNPLSVKSGQNAIGNGVAGANTTTQASNRYNIFVTPGYQFGADKLGYIKLGYSAEQLKAQNSGIQSASGTATASGFIVGLGYKQLIDKNIYVFGEANYMTYSNTKIGIGSTNTGASLGVNTTPSTYQALVGIGYKF